VILDKLEFAVGGWAKALAENWIRRGVAVDGGDPQARSILAVALYMRGDHAGAVFEARNALALSQSLADAHGVLGAALIFSGRPQDGLSSLETCIRLDPRSPRLSTRLTSQSDRTLLLQRLRGCGTSSG
jgi:adenylate cyclase